MDIDAWLHEIGLAQYAETFRANDIDGELLGRLTGDDLKEIGVASFGHRKKLLEAIAALGSATAVAPATPPVLPAPILAAVVPPQISHGRSRWRAPLSHGNVLRSGGFDRHCGAARR